MQEQDRPMRHEPGDPGMEWEPLPAPPAEVEAPDDEAFALLVRQWGLGDLKGPAVTHDYRRLTVQVLEHGEQGYADLLDRIRRDGDLVAAMWQDAESRPDELDVPGTVLAAVVLGDGTPAAWAAATVVGDGTVRCHSNYEVPQHRGRGLYAMAYHARHCNVVLVHQLPAVTYLFPEPIGLHLADGWSMDIAAGGAGTSVAVAGGPVHHWQRLFWAPGRSRRF